MLHIQDNQVLLEYKIIQEQNYEIKVKIRRLNLNDKIKKVKSYQTSKI